MASCFLAVLSVAVLDHTSFPFTCITPCCLVTLVSLVKYFQPKTSLLCHLSVCKSSRGGRQLFPHFPRLHNAQHTVLETAEPIHADNARMLGLDSSASHQWHMVHSQRRLSSLQPFSTPTTAFSLKTKPRINYLSKLSAQSYFL